jgi:hypothetical protein
MAAKMQKNKLEQERQQLKKTDMDMVVAIVISSSNCKDDYIIISFS